VLRSDGASVVGSVCRAFCTRIVLPAVSHRVGGRRIVLGIGFFTSAWCVVGLILLRWPYAG